MPQHIFSFFSSIYFYFYFLFFFLLKKKRIDEKHVYIFIAFRVALSIISDAELRMGRFSMTMSRSIHLLLTFFLGLTFCVRGELELGGFLSISALLLSLTPVFHSAICSFVQPTDLVGQYLSHRTVSLLFLPSGEQEEKKRFSNEPEGGKKN